LIERSEAEERSAEPVCPTIGILAIGSLYWDPDRKEWQRSRLSMHDAVSAAVPIRYGRLSKGEKRKDTYTMIFSSQLRECEFGTAKVIPCVNNVTCLADLLHEARLLWFAEDPNAKRNAIASKFGCVVLLRNPNGNAADELVDGWANHVVGETHFLDLVRGIEKARLISERGLLQIRWPKLDSGEPVNLDLLLATVNEPTLNGNPPAYPSAEKIALALKQALKARPGEQPDDYFWKNKQSGITTFQDEDIERVLNNRSGCLSLLRSVFAF
jgi:hypothetical protein